MIQSNMKIGSVVRRPEFKGCEHVAGEMPGLMGVMFNHMTMDAICRKMKTWNAASMAEGMNYLSERAKKGKVFYDFWTEEEKREQPSRKRTGMAAFPLKKKAPFVVVCAGGGYASVCSMVEAYPIAKRINELGYAAFVVEYRVGRNAAAPNPIDDLAQAVRFILSHDKELNIIPKDYAVAGFSAGGHLAASFGTGAHGYAKYGLPKPASMFLAYPVITLQEKTHMGSRKAFLGKQAKEVRMQKKYSVEELITDAYPASYVWQFDRDDTVPIENTKMLVQKLEANGIPFAYETFPGTAHGVGIGTGTPAEGWVEKAVSFWEKQGGAVTGYRYLAEKRGKKEIC